MTYKEIKDRLSKCELTLEKIKNGSYHNVKTVDVTKKQEQLEILRESYIKLLNEASEKTYLVTPKSGKTAALSLGDDEVDALKDADDIEKIKSSDGDEVKEEEGVKFTVEETKSIAKKVGAAVAKALSSLGDEVAHMKAKSIEENSFEIYVQYKNDSDDQFSFYIVGDTLHLTDFSFDREMVDVGVKPSGEAVVHVDVLANELVKHFKSMNESEVNEAPEGMYYIEVSVRDARKALAIIDDQPALKNAVEMNGSNVYYLTDEGLAYDLMMDFGAQGIEVVDTNIEDEDDMLQEKEVEAPEGGIDHGGDLDVGHQDDEPNMLKKDLYDVITYASKLYKALDKYDQHDGEVDFPHWWQKKVTLAREYMSAAQHYLEGEEKQPAIDQLALENASAEEENKFHKKLDTLVHNTFGKRKEELKEWGSSDQNIFNQSIHKALGEPKSMPSPFSRELESAAEDAVDHYWDDWEEYDTDREGLVEHAKKAYLRAYFKETFNKMVQMFSESMNEEMDENRFLAASMEDLEQVIRNLAHTGEMSEDEAIELAIRKLEAMLDGRDDMDEGLAKTQKAHGLVVAKMKELAKQYKAGDKSVVAQLKDLTAKKKQLEKQLEKDVAGKNRNQQLDTNIDENEENEARISKPRFVKDKNNPNFLNVYIDYDLGPGGSSIALGKETMTGQIRRESAAKAMQLANKVAKDLEAKYNLEDIDITDLENGKVRIFAVSDDFINVNIKQQGLNEKEDKVKHQGSNYKWPMSQATKDRKEADKAAQAAKRKSLKEEKSTCCGKCGRKHVKGTKCKTPYLKGKDHCRTR